MELVVTQHEKVATHTGFVATHRQKVATHPKPHKNAPLPKHKGSRAFFIAQANFPDKHPISFRAAGCGRNPFCTG